MQPDKFFNKKAVRTLILFLIKVIPCLFVLCVLIYAYGVQAAPLKNNVSYRSNDVNTLSYLHQMHQAVVNKNYTIVFINAGAGKHNTAFAYHHVVITNQPFAKLLYLEGTSKEIVLKADSVNYYQQDHDSFSIKSERIIEAFPDIVFNNFDKLNQYYDYIALGKGRVANRHAQVIRIMPKDKDRYNYLIWVDESSFLPLRIDLFDNRHQLLKQFKIVSLLLLTQSQSIPLLDSIKSTQNYPLLAIPDKVSSLSNQWQLNWLPSGFVERSHSRLDFKKTDIDTRLYSDGVFSFAVTVSENPLIMKSYSLQSDNQIIYFTQLFGKEITIIGDLPLDTIKKIAKHITIKTSS